MLLKILHRQQGGSELERTVLLPHGLFNRKRGRTAALLRRADAARDAASYANAAQLYDEALKLGARDVAILVQCGNMHKEAGHLDLAEARYLEALERSPNDSEVLLQLGHYYKIAERYFDAQAFYRKALAARPGWSTPREALAHLANITLVHSADVARDSLNYKEAARLYDELLQRGEQNADVLLQAGHMHKEAGNLDIAEARYLEALYLAPSNAEILLQLGHYYKISRSYLDCEAYYLSALAARPMWSEAMDTIDRLRADVEFVQEMASVKEKVKALHHIVRRADAARDEGNYAQAAQLYDEALRLGKRSPGILLQSGHMHKESGNFEVAKARYLDALRRAPNDSEILLQLGHYYKVVGRYIDSETFYQRALIARRGWSEPRDEIRHLQNNIGLIREKENFKFRQLLDEADLDRISSESALIDADLFPHTEEELSIEHSPAFVFTRIGNCQTTPWGVGNTVRGVDALRGYVVSAVPYLLIEIYMDGTLIYKDKLIEAPQRREKKNHAIKKYCYNAWIDFSETRRGWHDFYFKAVNIHGDRREGIDCRRERIIVADPTQAGLFESSDSLVAPGDPTDRRSLAEQINGRPSVVRRSSTHSFPGPVQNIAVLRVDQLGDMCVSVPALKRLRDLLPSAKITGLISPANEGLARSLGVFDDLFLLDFPDDPIQHQRIMTREGQAALRQQLAPYKFDVAIDMAVSGVSYKLLPLTGAPITLGFGGEGNKLLDLNLSTHDPKTNNDMMRHSARARALIEAVGVWLDSGAHVIRRDDLDRSVLELYGIGPNDTFIVVHSGSRIKFTRWSHYPQLARGLLDRTAHKVVYMADDDSDRDRLPPEALADRRMIYIHERLPFDHLDAFLTFCDVFIGNDSGPKHLAALRGSKVVSIHSSRIGWAEWGQEQTGVIISRRVPCAGCSLHHEPEECARDFACIKYITVDEVQQEVLALLPSIA